MFLITLYFGIAFFGPDFYKTPHKNYKDFTVLFIQWGILFFASFGLIYFIALNKYIFAFAFPLLVIPAAVLAYFRTTVNATLNANLIDIALHNDFNTTSDMISLALIIFVVANIMLSLIAVLYRFKRIKKRIYVLEIIIASFLIYFTTHYQRTRSAVNNRIPYVLYFSFKDYFDNAKTVKATRADLTANSQTNIDSLTVVFVLGESLRADHLSINGYKRTTTPLIDSNKNIISFPQVYVPYTNTDKCVPYILTNADSLHPERANLNHSFISFFKKCGYQTYWIANQQPTDSYAFFTKEPNKLIYTNPEKNLYNFEPHSWLDEKMLVPAERIINNAERKKLIICHMIGSHWWFPVHYSKAFERYTPVSQSRIVSSNSDKEMANSYDNTILYTDFFLNSLIEKIKNKKAVLIYLSDHGEALGEEDMWLHANEALPVHNPACIIWISDLYKKDYPEVMDILTKNAKERWDAAFLFHSILDAAQIITPYLDKNHSIFRKRN